MYLEPSEYRLWLQLEQPLVPGSAVSLLETPSPIRQRGKISDNNGYIHVAAALHPCCVL